MIKGVTLQELLLVLWLICIVVFTTLYCIWTGHNIDFVMSAIKGHQVHVPMWLSSIAAILSNGIGLVFNIVVEIFKLAK